MSTDTRVPREGATREFPDQTEFAESMSKFFVSGVDRMAEVQKKTMDVAAQQTAEALEFWKTAVRSMPGAPGLSMLELAAGSVERYVEIQKGIVDLFAEQSHAMAGFMKERTAAATKTTENVVKTAREAVGRNIAAQKKTLEHAAAQTDAFFEAAKGQFGGNGGPAEAAADSIQRGVNAMIDAQKELLEAAGR